MSLPTRGAWIEMFADAEILAAYDVAPHAGGVD